MKLVISDVKTGFSYQKELEKGKEAQLLGKKIGDAVDGGIVGMDGYSLKITGGSSKEGLPMRADIKGQRKTGALLSCGTGVRNLKKGQRLKKNVYGNTISADIFQLNLKIVGVGAKKLDELGFVQKVKEKGAEKEAKPAK